MKKSAKATTIKFKPAGDRVLVMPDSMNEERTASGIYIPDSAKKEKPETGVIVAIGEGKRTEKGEIVPIRYKAGQKVMFSKYSEQEITIDETEYYIIKESDIVGTF